jgi:hypothetical protein
LRFKGTLILFVLCLGLGAYLYFYEIKGGEKREQAKQAENQVWKLESNSIRQIDILSAGQQITLVRNGESNWAITAPRSLEADADEMNRLANAASDIRRESIVEENATDLARFGLNPPQSSLKLKTKEGKNFEIYFGQTNPVGSFTYAALPGRKTVYLVNSATAGAFNKKLDDLRNRAVLSFERLEAQSLSIKSEKGDLELTKDSNDLWWLSKNEKVAADSPGIRGILNALSMARIKEFYPEPVDGSAKPAMDRPLISVSLVCGKNRSLKRLTIGPEKSQNPGISSEKLYLAKDESRPDLFYVDKELVNKLLQSRDDLREKAFAVFQRWDIDSISLKNNKGSITLVKAGGEWFVGSDKKKKAKFDAVNGILDSFEKKTVELIENPSLLSKYGLDKPSVQAVLKQGSNVVVECSVGGSSAKGLYAQVKGDPAVKVIDFESAAKLYAGESDLVEPPAAAPKK